MKKLSNIFKSFVLLCTLMVSFSAQSQNYTHDQKVISTMPTETKSFEIKIKNEGEIPEVFIIYKYIPGDHFWQKIGSVSVFSMTEAKFYVEKGPNYGFNVEGRRPIKIGADEKKWRVKYHKGYDEE